MKLILVRHGETETDNCRRYWGHSDIGLSDSGHAQANSLREYLSAVRIDAIYSSPLKRCMETAETIAYGRPLSVNKNNDLKEIDFGRVEGLTYDDVLERYPDIAQKWAEGSFDVHFPDGEGMNHFAQRVVKFVKMLSKHREDETLLLVGHGGVFRILICHFLGIDYKHWWQFTLGVGSVTVLDIYPEGSILEKLNDKSHLG